MEKVDQLAIYSTLRDATMPLWLVALVVAFALPMASIVGHWAGRVTLRRHCRAGETKALPGGETTLAAMLALLGLLLGFTYSFGLSRADARTEAVTEEAIAIGTAFVRADLLAEPGRSELQKALLAYAKTRRVTEGDTLRTQEDVLAVIERSLEAQAHLWPTTLRAIKPETPAPIAALIVSGTSEVLDAHTRRLAAMSEHIPDFVMALLFAAAAVGLAVAGSDSAFRGRSLSWRNVAFPLILAAVIVVIFDFERPREGLIRLNSDALIITIAEMEAAAARAAPPPKDG